MNHEIGFNKTETFQADLQSILNTGLTPANFESYANDALERLIELSEATRSAYNSAPTVGHIEPKAEEDNAFRYFGLEELDTALTHVITLSEDIDRIKKFAEAIPSSLQKILHPNEGRMSITPGEGDFREKATVPRLGTTLFVLEKDYGISLDDPEQLQIVLSAEDPATVRKAPYIMLDIPSIERAVMVCDEVDNATFVLDTTKLTSLDKSLTDAMSMSKHELNEFLRAHSGVGRRLRFGSQFVSQLKELLSFNIGEPSPKRETPVSYLHSKVPEDLLSLKGISRAIGKSQGLIQRIYSENKDIIGEGEQYFVGGKSRMYLDFVGQAIILYALEEAGHFREQVPDDRPTLKEQVKDWPVGDRVIEKKYAELIENGVLKDVPLYLDVYGKLKRYPTEEQITILKNSLEEEGLLAPKASKDEWSRESLGKELGISPQTVTRAIAEIEDTIGPMPNRWFGSMISPSLNSVQKEKLIAHLAATERYYPLPEEGVLSIKKAAPELGMSDITLLRVVTIMREKGLLGEKCMYRFRGRPGVGLSPSDREAIKAFAPQAVRGYGTKDS